MSQFYQIDSAKVTLRERWWWNNRSPLVIIAVMLSWLRVRIPCSSDDANTESTLPFVTTGFPPEIETMCAPLTQQLAQLDFVDPVFHVIYDAGSSTTLYWATFRHTSGGHLARIHHRAWGQSTKRKPVLFPMFITRFADGTFLVSSAGKPDMAAPDTIHMLRKQNANLAQLWSIHEQKSKDLASRVMVSPVMCRDDIFATCEALHILQRDFHLARGVFRPRTEAEIAKAQATAARVEAARASGYENAEVLAELEKLQDKKTSKQMMLWILLGSLAGFLAVGAANWSWKFTLWLIPVLIFHEAGHWCTMRIFKYRNLRMFFIPMFGAAVMGQHWNVPGWKKALVSLAGPLPGIALGLAVGIGSIMLHNQWMNKAALMLLLINGMNLLPIFPLDGGHVLQDTIFCRNRWLEAVFRLLAIGGLLLLGAGGRAFLYLGIALAVSLPITFKLAKVKEELSKHDLPQPGPHEDSIPLPTAQAIIKAVQATFGPKMRLSNKALAQHSLNVFESLNAKPPGVLATLGLLAMQGGGLFIAVVMGLLLVFTGQVGLRDFASMAARQPRHSVNCKALQQWGAIPAEARPTHLIVTTFKGVDQAAAAFVELTNQLPANCRLTHYGQSVLLSIPAGDEALREKWFDAMQSRSTNLFVQVSNAPLLLSMQFIAPTKASASNLTQELNEYLHDSALMRLIPPWSPDSHIASYAQYRKARAAWQKIGVQLAEIYTNSEYKTLGVKVGAALKRGAVGEAQKLEKERAKRAKELRAQALENLDREDASIGADLAALYGKLEEISYTNRAERQKVCREVAAKLGEVRYLNDKPEPLADSYTASGGSLSMHGLLCQLDWANFAAPQGIVSLTQWLCDKGCLQIRYDVQGGWTDVGEIPED